MANEEATTEAPIGNPGWTVSGGAGPTAMEVPKGDPSVTDPKIEVSETPQNDPTTAGTDWKAPRKEDENG